MFRDWERLWLRASHYKNHRIFTLRCIHKDLFPHSIKLKTTIKTNKARKIIKQAERNLLQARVKAINSILDNVSKQTQLCRSKLTSILSTQRFGECQGFIEKVAEIRFHKVKQRQVNKFNNLLRKEGNITGVSTLSCSHAGSQAGDSAASQEASTIPPNRLVAFQAGRQAGAHLHGDSTASQAVSTVTRGGSSLASQAGRFPSQGHHFFPGKQCSFPQHSCKGRSFPGGQSPLNSGRQAGRQ